MDKSREGERESGEVVQVFSLSFFLSFFSSLPSIITAEFVLAGKQAGQFAKERTSAVESTYFSIHLSVSSGRVEPCNDVGIFEDGAAKGADRDLVVPNGSNRCAVAGCRASGASDVVSRPIAATAECKKGRSGGTSGGG